MKINHCNIHNVSSFNVSSKIIVNILWLFDIYCPTLIVFLVMLGGLFQESVFQRQVLLDVSCLQLPENKWIRSRRILFTSSSLDSRQQLMLGVMWKVFGQGLGEVGSSRVMCVRIRNSLAFEVMLVTLQALTALLDSPGFTMLLVVVKRNWLSDSSRSFFFF